MKAARRESLRNWSLSRRLTSLYALSSFLMLILAATYLHWSLVESLRREDIAFLADKIQECRRLLFEHPKNRELLAHEIEVEAAASQFIKHYIRLLDDQGRTILETPGMEDVAPINSFPAAAHVANVPKSGTVWKSNVGRSFLLMSAEVAIHAENSAPRIVQVALDDSPDEALLIAYRWKLLLVIALGVSFSCVIGYLVVQKGLQPLKDMAKATDQISASQLHERIAANTWPDELSLLARSFDRMLNRLEDSFSRLSQFSADLAHELRTPINNLRGEAGVALSQVRTADQYRQVLESGLEEYARLSRLIDNLLFLARTDGAVTRITRSNCDARKAVEGVREYYEALAEDRDVNVECEGVATVEADPMLLRQAVSNLLANALNHTPRGGKVRIVVRELTDGSIEIVVADAGAGIPAEHLSKVFDRLYQVDSSRSRHANGSGLGLAIVRSIMELHGGTVSVQSEMGKGSVFTLNFPASNSPTPDFRNL